METDQELLSGYVVAGDERAFQEIVLRYQGLVMGVARTHLRGADCEDVIQETFLALATRASSVRSHLAGWLFMTARNHALLIQRREKRQHRELLDDDQLPDRPQPEADGEVEILRDLDAAMAQLSVAERDLLLQRYCSGRTLADIAHDQNRSIAAIHGRIETALAKLRRHLRQADASTPVIALGALISVDPPARLLPLVMKPVLGGTLHAKMAAVGTTTIGTWLVLFGWALALCGVAGATWYLLPFAGTTRPVQAPADRPDPKPATAAAALVQEIDPRQITWSDEALAHYARGEPVPLGSSTESNWQVQDFMTTPIGGGKIIIRKDMAPLWHVPAGSRLEPAGQALHLIQPAGAPPVYLFGGRTAAPRWRFDLSAAGTLSGRKRWSFGVYGPRTTSLDLKEPIGAMRIKSNADGTHWSDPGTNAFTGVIEGVKVGSHRGQPIYQIRAYTGTTVTMSLWLVGLLDGLDVTCPGGDFQITRAQLSCVTDPQSP